jgi:pimeloyl-ACP methyl ester carboxylesterase
MTLSVTDAFVLYVFLVGVMAGMFVSMLIGGPAALMYLNRHLDRIARIAQLNEPWDPRDREQAGLEEFP